ncbi:MAG: ABC transporter permease [Chitinophagaceae bacterium]
MGKIGLIIKREYLSRVRKKTFILTTILTPLLFVGVIGLVVFITVKNVTHQTVAVVDPNGYLKQSLESNSVVTYTFDSNVDTSNFADKGYTAILIAPQTGINKTSNFQLVSDKSLSSIANDRIQDDIATTLENNIISDSLKIDPKLIEAIKKRADETKLVQIKKDEYGTLQQSNFKLASSIGYVTAFLIYITLFIYGVMVMRGVMEEKTNRIAEVIVSSVKPFQLMLGKIIGIGAVGLTQFFIWIILLFGISTILTSMIPPDVLHQMQQQQGSFNASSQQTSEAVQTIAAAKSTLSTINWPLVIGCFVFFFIGGYLFYASLFAAVGSAVNEDIQDAQSLTFPITLPIIIAIILMINCINDPTSQLATWSSLVPFFSPIVMMARVPFGVPGTVPYWQLGTSMALLVLGFLFTTWLSAKIYRTGILMYGKKPTWKELIKWARM